MKKIFLIVLAAALGMIVVSCNDEANEEFINTSNNSTSGLNSIVKKEITRVTYSINAKVKDINGKDHFFNGNITVTYYDGKPITATFTGFYDGKYYDGVGIIFYVRSDTDYSYFEEDPNTIFAALLSQVQDNIELL